MGSKLKNLWALLSVSLGSGLSARLSRSIAKPLAQSLADSGLANGSSSSETSFTSASLSAGTFTITHNLNRHAPPVSIVDNTGAGVRPDSITFPSVNSCTIDLSSYGTIAGTWWIAVDKDNTSVEQSFVNGGLTAGTLTVTHNLNRHALPVQVVDNTGAQVRPDSVTYPSVNTATIDLSSYGAIAGTWWIGVL